MEITLYRDTELKREARSLPAPLYNLARRLIAHSPSGVAFVPVRNMQYLAILERGEFVFVDHLDKSCICIAWQHFRPQLRTSLDEPVSYEAVTYHPDGTAIMQRLLSEFPKALQQLDARDKIDGPSKVLKFDRNRSA